MPPTPNQPDADLGSLLDQLASAAAVQSNCMFQLAVMLARIAVEPCADAYKEESAQALLGLIRAKPKSNVVRLFGAGSGADQPGDGAATVLQFAAR